MEFKKMNALELLKKAEITKEDFKQEVVFKTLFNILNDMICEEDKLENEYIKLKRRFNYLNMHVSALLIAVEQGNVKIFPEYDDVPDYIQKLEDVQSEIVSEVVFSISLENFLRNKLHETEEMQEYSVSNDTIRCWIDEYNNRA